MPTKWDRAFEVVISEQEMSEFVAALSGADPNRGSDTLRGMIIQPVRLPSEEWINKIPDMAMRGRFMIVSCPTGGDPVLAYESNK